MGIRHSGKRKPCSLIAGDSLSPLLMWKTAAIMWPLMGYTVDENGVRGL